MSEAVICAFLRDFREHGQRAIAKVRRTQPAAYCKLAVLLVPREHKVEQTNVIGQLTDEQLEAMIEELKERIARRAEQAKLIEGEAVDTTVPKAPVEAFKARRPNKIMEAADTAIGPRERPKKRKMPLPLGA